MTTSEKGINLIKEHEGLQLKAYKCPAGVWTIGYGHTVGVKEGQRINQQQAEAFLREDLRMFEQAINRAFPGINGLPQNKFDALVSFAFNVGVTNFQKSTLLAMIKREQHNPAIREQFMKWVYAAGGKVLPGLQRRRKAEADLYFEK